MTQVIDFIKLFWRTRSGISSAEYALMLALVAGGIVIAAAALGTAVSGEINEATNCIGDGTQCN